MNIPIPKHVTDCEGEAGSQHVAFCRIRVLGVCGVTFPRDSPQYIASRPPIVAGEAKFVQSAHFQQKRTACGPPLHSHKLSCWDSV